MNIEEKIKSIIDNILNDNIEIADLHPCQYCKGLCKGKQCRECHLKMIKDRQGNCIDCDRLFSAVRKDGTIKKRCRECQTLYDQKYISLCPECGDSYHAHLNDGRIFEKCYKCYQSSINRCHKCLGVTLIGCNLCTQCYHEMKEHTISVCRDKFNYDDITEIGDKCKSIDCDNTSSHTFCKQCYIKYKLLK